MFFPATLSITVNQISSIVFKPMSYASKLMTKCPNQPTPHQNGMCDTWTHLYKISARQHMGRPAVPVTTACMICKHLTSADALPAVYVRRQCGEKFGTNFSWADLKVYDSPRHDSYHTSTVIWTLVLPACTRCTSLSTPLVLMATVLQHYASFIPAAVVHYLMCYASAHVRSHYKIRAVINKVEAITFSGWNPHKETLCVYC
jgi:hypothetical protein